MAEPGKLRVLTDLDGSDTPPPSRNTWDVFCPALHGLPREHAWTVAQLPIHDANGLLLTALARSTSWPVHVWACIYPADPFRPPKTLLGALQQRGVAKICSFPCADALLGYTSQSLDASISGKDAIHAIGLEAQRRGMQFRALSFDEVKGD